MEIRLESVSEFENDREKFYEWASYLLDEFGYDGSQNVLVSYMDLGWISEEIRQEMEDILVSSQIQANTNYKLPDIDWPPIGSLINTKFEKHAYSIHYIIELSDESNFSEI